jgi:hypothetical protein
MNTNVARRFPAALALIVASSALVAVPSFAGDDHHGHKFATELSGYNEVHFVATAPALRGAISTKAKGKFKAAIDDDKKMIHYELEWKDLEGIVTQAHIHFGQKHTVGGIVVWLCETALNPGPVGSAGDGLPTCPGESNSGKVTGTIQPANVLAVTGQGIDAGEFDELVRAIRAGATYANVHSTVFGPGEVRGQIKKHDHRDHHRR